NKGLRRHTNVDYNDAGADFSRHCQESFVSGCCAARMTVSVALCGRPHRLGGKKNAQATRVTCAGEPALADRCTAPEIVYMMVLLTSADFALSRFSASKAVTAKYQVPPSRFSMCWLAWPTLLTV